MEDKVVDNESNFSVDDRVDGSISCAPCASTNPQNIEPNNVNELHENSKNNANISQSESANEADNISSTQKPMESQ